MPTHAIQILSKRDYTQQHIVTLPDDPLPPLPPNSLRLQSKLLGLTTNNFSYARLGHVLGWWDIHPLPSNTPTQYSDPSKFGRISAWGYAEIIYSTDPDIPIGKLLYGYLPIGTLPVDVTIKHTGATNQIRVLDEHRQHLWPIYNRYEICDPLTELEKQPGGADWLAWDAIMKVLFGTGYTLNCFGFAWLPENRIRPSGSDVSPSNPEGKSEWSAEDASLDDAMVVLLSASGKTAVSFAWAIRNERPKERQPKSIVGVCSSGSKTTVTEGELYDEVFLYNEADKARGLVDETKPRRVVLIDFGAREGAMKTWHETLKSVTADPASSSIGSVPATSTTGDTSNNVSQSPTFTSMGVGGEVRADPPEEANKRLAARGDRLVVNASVLREKGIEVRGDEYFKAFDESFNKFKGEGGMPGCKLQWGEGMGDWEKAWDKLARDEVSASTALVFRI